MLGIEKRNLSRIRQVLVDSNMTDEFVKLEIQLRGNNLVKKRWQQN